MSELSLPRILFSLSLPLSLSPLSPSYPPQISTLVFLVCLFIPRHPFPVRAFFHRISFFLSTKLYPRQSRDAFPDRRSPLRDQVDVRREREVTKKKKKKERNVENEISWKRAVFINPPLPFNRPLKDNQDRVVLIRDHCIF